jgi:hypothetical protein
MSENITLVAQALSLSVQMTNAEIKKARIRLLALQNSQ